MATKVIENSNTRLFGLIFFGKMASIYSANGPKTIAVPLLIVIFKLTSLPLWKQ